jgi:hypothetical protein
MDPEERALQIKLAQLDARLQIQIAYFFGFAALGGGLLVGGIAIIFSIPEGFTLGLILPLMILLSAIFSFYISFTHIDKLSSCREEIESLK